jgi:outer membrane protein assembly factor BamA
MQLTFRSMLGGCALVVAAHATPELEGRPVETVEVSGQRITRESVIRREIRTQAGGAFASRVMREDVQRLENLDIFSSVAASARLLGEGVVVEYVLRELPPTIPYISYDVTDEDGWSFGPAIKSVNMGGRDIFVGGWALFGGKNIFMLEVSDPWIGGNHLSVELDVARIERENVLDGFKETTFEFSPWLGMYRGDRGRLRFGLSYFQVESSEVGHTLSADNVDRIFRAGASAGYDSRDSWGDPHRGWLNQLQVIKSGRPLPGDGDFWTATFDLRRFQPVTGRQHTLVLAGLATLQTGRVGRDLPEYMDFHLGGSNSIRGYDVEDLGRTLVGSNQLIGTMEYRFPLVPSREITVWKSSTDLGVSGALFTDAGLAWTAGDEFSADRARVGVGLGLRLLMPAVEMTRLDLGIGDDGQWRVHFAAFSKMAAQRQRLR